ncbi:MAG TPA: allantoinase AllB [Candidatus Dormibacteraeota bacterium]|nr:allantoinase AllB [Candidatus Dormibacteraeota bacterium]
MRGLRSPRVYAWGVITNLVIRSERVVIRDAVRPSSIHIQDGRIKEVAGINEFPRDWPLYDVGRSVVMPGLVDTHVHVNEPGRADWEGFVSATRAAAAGGVTTLVDMPLNSIPPTTTCRALAEKLHAARGNCWVDVGFWGGVVPGNLAQLRPLFDSGVLGFKCFLISSGVAEFGHLEEPDLRMALEELARIGAVLAIHAELPGPVEEAEQAVKLQHANSRQYSTFLRSRPRTAEDQAVATVIRLSRETGCRAHIVHLSSSDALPALRQARAAGGAITVETCPHYLCLTAETIPEGATEFKCCPPIRESENNEALWSALDEGLIDMVVSDHSPCPPDMKRKGTGDFLLAWGGISSLQLRLPLVWTAAEQRSYSVSQLAAWLSFAPADLVGLSKTKGTIDKGYDADLVVWDPDATFGVDAAVLHHRHKLTPYSGQMLRGVVQATFLRGQKIYEKGTFVGIPSGEMILRGIA